MIFFFFSTLLTQELKPNGTIFKSTSNVVEAMVMLIMEAPLLETLILFLILAVEEIIVVKAVGQARLLKMKTKSDKKSTLMVAWKGKKNSIFQKQIRVFYMYVQGLQAQNRIFHLPITGSAIIIFE